MPKPSDWNYYRTITQNHSFFLDSKLHEARMWEISDWIGRINPEERKMLRDILKDQFDEFESRRYS